MAEPKAEEAAGIRLTNRAIDVPTIHADAVFFASLINDNVRLSLVETMIEPKDQENAGVYNRYVATVTMSGRNFLDAVAYLNEQVEFWRKQGRLPDA
jgi:hypothetical protein